VDVLPTAIDALGLSPAGGPGQSLLAPRGVGLAFSELVRRDRYLQSATSRTHHLVKRHVFEEEAHGTASDLVPGAVVSAKGPVLGDGTLMATNVDVGPEAVWKLRAVLDEIDVDAGRVRAAGLTLDVRDETEVEIFGERGALTALRAGDKASVSFVDDGDGRKRAIRIARRNDGHKSKLVGPISAVRHDQDGTSTLTVFGTAVVLRPGVRVDVARRARRGPRTPGEHLARVLAGDVVAESVELFDLDDLAAGDVAARRPDVAQELEAALAAWTLELISGAAGAPAQVEVDDETLEQLRRMGYVD
jgi:hypothetical protein